jgi:hypothetical protein
LSLTDPDAAFCDQGVQDLDAATTVQAKQFATSDAQLSSFGPAHTDFVQITSDFTDSDPYWSTPVGSACAKDDKNGVVGGINGCRTYFGTTTNFKATREWPILQAYQDHLVLGPGANDATGIANLHCCFPATVLYTVRATNTWIFRGQQPMTNVVVDPSNSNRCVIDDCNPRKKFLKNRIIEISSTDKACGDATSPPCSIGAPNKDLVDPVCVISDNTKLDLSSIGPGCVFDSLKARFVIYSGTNPSVRDMSFGWQVVGGFVPYELNLANHLTGSAIVPQSLLAAPNLDALFVVEGVSGGVFEIVLDPFVVNGDPYL